MVDYDRRRPLSGDNGRLQPSSVDFEQYQLRAILIRRPASQRFVGRIFGDRREISSPHAGFSGRCFFSPCGEKKRLL
ncbi:hypothetical protein GW17_00048928, partial [Ensete ventricosum]